jgi:predicted anti-sigma-YlaC factor YlaD
VKCKDVIREISDYLDGALEPEVLAELQRHLEHCEDCRLVVDTTKKTIQVFCNSEPAPLDPDTRERLHKALEQRLKRSSSN